MFLPILLILSASLLFANKVCFGQGLVSPEICESKECYQASEYILKWMNPLYKPCEDFYEFTCGYWHNPFNDTETKKHNRSIGSRGEFLKHHIEQFLLDDTTVKESKLFEIAKEFFNMCLDEEAIEARGVSSVIEYLRKAGGWPVVEKEWSEEKWDFLEAEIMTNGLFLGVNVVESPSNVTAFRIYTALSRYQMDVDPSDDDYNETLQEIYNVSCKAAEMFGADKDKAKKDMNDVVQFEIQVSEFLEGINKTGVSQWYTLPKLQEEIPWLNWTRLLASKLPDSVKLSKNQDVLVTIPTYVKELGDFIKKSKKRTLANWMMLKTLASLEKYLPTSMQDEDMKSHSRFDICMNILGRSSFAGIVATYISRRMAEDTAVAKEITEHILNELLIEVRDLDWLDDGTRSAAIDTLKHTKLMVSFPDELQNLDTVEELYKEVKISKLGFFESAMESERWMSKEQFKMLGKPIEQRSLTQDIQTAMSTNAYFVPDENAIFVTAGFLHFIPLFSSKVPLYVSYGHLGSIIAHELTHALDIQTAIPDEEEMLQLLYKWGDNKTGELYEEKKQCIIDLYSSFNDSKYTGQMLQGNHTDREDVADIGGLKLAWKAYLRMAAQMDGPEPKLPNLQHYSIDQLFFISLANTYCEIPEKKALLSQLRHDVHSPFEFRIKGMMMNSPDFSEVFGCKESEPMNPKKKCSVWYMTFKN